MSYYSGQGRLYLAERTAQGRPMGFTAIGNVPSLEISIETTKFEHKESMSGSRAVDYSLIQEKKGTFTMTMEDISLANLAVAFWGATGAQAADTFSNFPVTARVAASGIDYRIPLIDSTTGEVFANVSSLVFNTATSGGGTTPEFGIIPGTTGTPGSSKNGWVDQANGVLTIFSTAEQTARGAAVNITDAQVFYITSGNHGATEFMDAFTVNSMERWLRFEGLNTVLTSGNNQVIIDIFKASVDPLQGYGLINEELASIELNGSVLYDDLQPGTSKYFKQINVS